MGSILWCVNCAPNLPQRSGSKPMLDQSKGGCMISIININNGIKEPTQGYQNCNTNQITIFGWYVRVREYLYT